MSVEHRARRQCPPAVVLAAVDFGDASARAVALAGAIASASGAALRVIHAERFEPPPYFTLEQIGRLQAERRAGQAAALEYVSAFAAGATAYPADPIVVDEPPVDAVLHEAASADLVVVGTHGRRGPGRWWLGSVAERVVRGAAMPVLVTRAATGPILSVFEHIALVGGAAGSDERVWAEHLAATFGGRIIEGGEVASCRVDAIDQAFLVVLPLGGGPGATMLTDLVARVLQACTHPVLFVPASSEPRRRDLPTPDSSRPSTRS